MKAEKLHSYMLPTGRRLVIRELTVAVAEDLAIKAAAKAMAGGDVDAVASSRMFERREQRRVSIVQLGDRRVSSDVSPLDLLDDMTLAEVQCLDQAIAAWSEVAPEVMRDFLASCDSTPETRKPRVVSAD